MPPRVPPSRIAQALEYLQGLKSGVGEFVGGVGTTLADRAKAAGGLAYEALTSDPNISRMNTAEFSEAAANRQTPRLDQAARDIGAIGRAIVTQPVQTAKAVVVDPVVNAFESPRAMGQFAGEFVNPLRIAAALRKTAPIAELDVYHGTPHKYAPTEANPLGEFDASKIGTGEGAQAYGHGVYLAETPEVAKSYKTAGVDKNDPAFVSTARQYAQDPLFGETLAEKLVTLRRDPNDQFGQKAADYLEKNYDVLRNQGGSLYKADLPDEMIDRMLDWDKPLSEQPAAVKNLYPRLVNESDKFEKRFTIETNIPLKNGGTAKFPLTEYYKTPEDAQKAFKTLSGSQIYQRLSQVSGPQEISKKLKKFGIPGIRYLDAGSRDGGSGTRNFVVFPGEEKKVRILERK
jgi:hypothetical protein